MPWPLVIATASGTKAVAGSSPPIFTSLRFLGFFLQAFCSQSLIAESKYEAWFSNATTADLCNASIFACNSKSSKFAAINSDSPTVIGASLAAGQKGVPLLASRFIFTAVQKCSQYRWSNNL